MSERLPCSRGGQRGRREAPGAGTHPDRVPRRRARRSTRLGSTSSRGTLAEAFPLLHERLALHRVLDRSLLFHWGGTGDADPLVLMAHIDVVPIDESAPWQHPPFCAEVHDGAVWGRGTLDDKGSLVGICAAVERLLEQGFVPARDVWLSFGAREETSGADASAAAAELRSRGVTPWFVLDEGGAIAHEAFPGVDPPLGVVGVSEKGTTTIELRAEGRGGHSSTPSSRRADRADRPGRRTTGEAAVRRLAARADAGDVRAARAVRPAGPAPAVRQRPPAAAAGQAGAAAAGAEPAAWCVRRWPSPRSRAHRHTT